MQAVPSISLLTRSASFLAASPFGWPFSATTWLNLMTISPLSQPSEAKCLTGEHGER